MRFRSLKAVAVALVACAAAATAAPSALSAGRAGARPEAGGAARHASSLARIEIPRIGLDAPLGVVPNLDRGPGFYPDTSRPGDGRTVAIAGHRTTHTRPFWALNELRRGDPIVIFWSGRRYVYRVTGMQIVSPTDWSVVQEQGYERLVLSSCNPRFSARQRIVVFALPQG